MTSASPEQRAISPGRLSMLAFQIRRAVSYSASAGPDDHTAARRPELRDRFVGDRGAGAVDQRRLLP